MERPFSFEADGEPIEITPDNASLFRYRKIGAIGVGLAMYDHIFIVTDEENDLGVWGFLHDVAEKDKDMLTQQMLNAGFPCHLNLTDIAQCDIDAFERTYIQNIEDTIPEEWL